MSEVQSAIILVGGKGSRLTGLFPNTEKALVPVAGVPLLDHNLKYLSQQGIRRVLLLANSSQSIFKSYESRASEFGLQSIQVSWESEPLGTAGAIKNAKDLIRENDFLIMSGDTYFEGSLSSFLRPLSGTPARIGRESHSHFGQTGFVILNQDIFSSIPDKKMTSLEHEILPQLARVDIVTLEGAYFDIDTPTSYAELNADFVLREAFQRSQILGEILLTWLQGGVIYLNKGLESLKSILPIASHPLVSQEIRHLRAADSKDLLLTSQLMNGVMARQKMAQFSEVQNLIKEIEKGIALLSHSSGLFFSQGLPWRPALFLDRDGVVLKFVDHLHQADKVELMPGIVELIAQAHAKHWAVVVVTNQSGIGRGYFSWMEYDLVTEKMQELLAGKGQWFDAIYYSSFFAQSQRAYGLAHSSLRKPDSGMFILAQKNLRIRIDQSVMVGDSATDIEAGLRLGMAKVYFLHSNRKEEAAKLKQLQLAGYQEIDTLQPIKI